MNKAQRRRAKRERNEAARAKGKDPKDPNDTGFYDNRGREAMKTLNERPDWEASALERLRRLNQQEY